MASRNLTKIKRCWDDKIAQLESDIVVKTGETERTHTEQREELVQVLLTPRKRTLQVFQQVRFDAGYFLQKGGVWQKYTPGKGDGLS